ALSRQLSNEERRKAIVAGIAGGFGAVFGTPLAGASFALEAPNPLRPQWGGLLPALIAAGLGHLTCIHLGVTHTDYRSLIGERIPFELSTLLLAVAVGIAGGGAARLFVFSIHGMKRTYGRIDDPVLRAAVGAIAVVAVTMVLGTRVYNGLSIPLLVSAFDQPAVVYAFAIKLGLTVLTLGAGMKGGEVTPLFVIGGTLGSAIAGLAGLDPAAGAAMGFCAVFAGAARVPVACMFMGLELFGPGAAIPAALSCGLAFLVAGREGIYGR
ncbi:chloride channel protein, partial [bacterium]